MAPHHHWIVQKHSCVPHSDGQGWDPTEPGAAPVLKKRGQIGGSPDRRERDQTDANRTNLRTFVDLVQEIGYATAVAPMLIPFRALLQDNAPWHWSRASTALINSEFTPISDYFLSIYQKLFRNSELGGNSAMAPYSSVSLPADYYAEYCNAVKEESMKQSIAK